MRKLGLFTLAIAVALGLGSTVLRNPLAEAASPFTNVIVGNTSSNPVPVTEQNIDANGDLKVHEQGTAAVSIQNTDGKGNVKVHEQGTADTRLTAYPQAPNVHVRADDLSNNNGFQITDQFGTINASTIVLTSVLAGCVVRFEVAAPTGVAAFTVAVPPNQTVTIPLPETVGVSAVVATGIGGGPLAKTPLRSLEATALFTPERRRVVKAIRPSSWPDSAGPVRQGRVLRRDRGTPIDCSVDGSAIRLVHSGCWEGLVLPSH